MRDDAWYTNAYREDGAPVYCTNCGHNEFSDRGTLMDGLLRLESYVVCNTCGNDVAYWAYGYYDPAYTNRE